MCASFDVSVHFEAWLGFVWYNVQASCATGSVSDVFLNRRIHTCLFSLLQRNSRLHCLLIWWFIFLSASVKVNLCVLRVKWVYTKSSLTCSLLVRAVCLPEIQVSRWDVCCAYLRYRYPGESTSSRYQQWTGFWWVHILHIEIQFPSLINRSCWNLHLPVSLFFFSSCAFRTLFYRIIGVQNANAASPGDRWQGSVCFYNCKRLEGVGTVNCWWICILLVQ